MRQGTHFHAPTIQTNSFCFREFFLINNNFLDSSLIDCLKLNQKFSQQNYQIMQLLNVTSIKYLIDYDLNNF